MTFQRKSPPLISIVIITLNEAKNIAETIISVREAAQFPSGNSIPIEIIVSDGGSTDKTKEIARELADVVVEAPRGRPQQCNLGGQIAKSDILLFLHADITMNNGSLLLLLDRMKNPLKLGGAFTKKWKWSNNSNPTNFMRASAYTFGWVGNILFRTFKAFPADNAIFVRKRVFEKLGGFAPMWICEGFDFGLRLLKFAKKNLPKSISNWRGGKGIACIYGLSIYTSTRRFEKHGFFRTLWKWILISLLWRLGMPQDRLKVLFNKYWNAPAY